jgi:electron transfer flavoprotein beta subunit
MPDAAVLLSVGRHPVSGRPRRAPTDAQALELAFGLDGWSVRGIHAGDPAEPALRDYLGMGLERLTALAVPAEADPVEPLVAHLRRLRPSVILTGRRAEGGEDSGMVPFLVAKALNAAIVSDVVSLVVSGGRAEVVQALPRGQRRSVGVALPFVATVHPAAPPARQVAFGRARRGLVEAVPVEAATDVFLAECSTEAWRPRPRMMRVRRGGSASDRLKAATESRAGDGMVMVDATPEEAARAIYESLIEQGVLS